MMLARDAEAAVALRAALAQGTPEGGAFVPFRLAEDGLRVETRGEAAVGPLRGQFLRESSQPTLCAKAHKGWGTR
jgi:hypothetical protein